MGVVGFSLSIDFFANIATELSIALDVSGLWSGFMTSAADVIDLSVNVYWLKLYSYLGNIPALANFEADIKVALTKFSGFSGELSIAAQLDAFFEVNLSAEIYAILKTVFFGPTFVGLAFILEVFVILELQFQNLVLKLSLKSHAAALSDIFTS